MSKHKDTKPALADWEVTDTSGGYGSPRNRLITQARWKRARADWVIFRDEQGIVAAYGPGAVLSIIRKEPQVVIHPPGLDAVGELGRSLASRGDPGPIETGRP